MAKTSTQEYIEKIAARLETTKTDAKKAYDAVFGVAKEILEVPNQGFTVSGFATFASEIKPETEGKNNLTGEVQVFPERLKVKAKFSKGLGK